MRPAAHEPLRMHAVGLVEGPLPDDHGASVLAAVDRRGREEGEPFMRTVDVPLDRIAAPWFPLVYAEPSPGPDRPVLGDAGLACSYQLTRDRGS